MDQTVNIVINLSGRKPKIFRLLHPVNTQDQSRQHYQDLGPGIHTNWFSKATDQKVWSQYWAENGLAGFNV